MQLAEALTTSEAQTEALRLADGLLFSTQDGLLRVESTCHGGSILLPRSALPVLEQLMDWTTLAQLGACCQQHDPAQAATCDVLMVLRALLGIDALMTRSEDLSGARLPAPGVGWAEAMRFLRATRTAASTAFAPPAAYNAALAQKAVFTRQASAFMEYPEASFTPLSVTDWAEQHGPSFADTMLQRRTARRYDTRALSEPQLSMLLQMGWGIVKTVPNPLGDVFVRKTSPSGGSLHPVEVYPIILNVEGLSSGLYHYSVRRHGLEQLWLGDAREWIAHACGDQQWVAEAAVVVLCTAFLPRTAWKYDFSRVARAVMAETGFSGQSALLTASWLGLGGFTTLALRDEIFETLIGLDPEREPVFSVIGFGTLEPEIADHSRPRNEPEPGKEAADDS